MKLTLLTIALAAWANAAEPDQVREILETSGVTGGLVVHVGCGDGKLTVALRANDSFIVHGLDADAKNADSARKHIQSLGLSGPVSAQQWAGKRLPYADNLVNLVVVSGQRSVDRAELLRVLCPGGVAVFLTNDKGPMTNDKLVKPWPQEIDEWTHYLHDASNNAVADGKPLWTLPGAKGFGAVNPPDLFVADGLVWYGSGKPEMEQITGYDPLTGQPARTVEVGPLVTHGHHARCYRSKATDDFLLLPKRGVEFISLDGGQHSRNNWVRGACRYGVMPCNGLLYSTPHPCFCYAGVKLGGFLALAPARSESGVEREAPSRERLERGPAFGAISNQNSEIPNPADWPMYRHDPKRSGSTTATVGTELGPSWKTDLGGKLTQPVVAEGRLFVARVDAGQVCCLDAATGKTLWDFIGGGRVDSSPTYYQGRLIFGSADGWVCCLRASDGALAWRFQAAPDQRCVVACGQVESAWPVHGSVLVLNDTVYFTAGRSSFLDGGIFLYGLDPVTGEIRCQTRLDGPRPDTTQRDENAYAMEGAKSDILVSDGQLLYLFHNVFNAKLEKQPAPVLGEPGVRNLGERQFGEHLFANAGFLDDSWFSRNQWMLGDHWTAFNFAHQAPKEGELLVFDDAHTYAVKCFVRRNMLSPLFFPATDGYFLVADSNAARPVVVNPRQQSNWLRWLPQEGELQKCWNLDVGFARAEPPRWMTNTPVRIRALVRTANALYAAGPPDVCDPADPLGALEGRKGAVLLAFNPADGKKVLEIGLEAPPVFDGMTAANGRLYLSTLDGKVICLGAGPGQPLRGFLTPPS